MASRWSRTERRRRQWSHLDAVDALQEDAACAPGVFVDVWNQSSPWPPLPCSFIALIGNRAIGLKPKNGEDGLLYANFSGKPLT